MKTTIEPSAKAIYVSKTPMAYIRMQAAGQGLSSLFGQNKAVMASAGAALLVLALYALQWIGPFAMLCIFKSLSSAIFWYFTLKSIFAMDFNINPTHEEMTLILEELRN